MNGTYKNMQTGEIFVIESDTDYESPRDCDPAGTMVCWHGRYNLGDIQPKERPDAYRATLPKTRLELPLYLYDHSMQSMSTRSFLGRALHAEWDSGQVGFIYIPRKKACKEWPKKRSESMEAWEKRILSHLEAEVENYDQYLRGEVYRYQSSSGDSCGGFYPSRGLTDIGNAAAFLNVPSHVLSYLGDESVFETLVMENAHA